MWIVKGAIAFVLLTVLAVAIAGMWGISAAANFAHAYQLAGGSAYVHIFAGASVASDVFKAASLVSLGAAIRSRLWGVAAAAFVLWTVTMGWSVKSSIGFASTMTMETMAQNETASDIKQSIKEELDKLQLQQTFLRGQMTAKVTGANAGERGQIREERAYALEEAKRMEDRITALRTQLLQSSHVVTVRRGDIADPAAQFLVENAGLPKRIAELATVLGFLALLELGSGLSFFAFGHLYFGSRRAEGSVSHLPSAAMQPDIQPPQGFVVKHQASGRRVNSTLRSQAQVYKDDLVHTFGSGAVVDRVSVLDAFDVWAMREGVLRPLARNQLAQQLQCCGVVREGEGYRLP